MYVVLFFLMYVVYSHNDTGRSNSNMMLTAKPPVTSSLPSFTSFNAFTETTPVTDAEVYLTEGPPCCSRAGCCSKNWNPRWSPRWCSHSLGHNESLVAHEYHLFYHQC